jgi:acyl transferase domain-containing protein/NAD(P)H-dependent flavin oxidoreductase YrpB (nitropropane dioxygenase family)/NAD(P)-dependent dehydrogenase (short-subunit alcohol dehydrogenase family)/acyl carrier protein
MNPINSCAEKMPLLEQLPPLLAITPLEQADMKLAAVLTLHQLAVAIDIGRDALKWPALMENLAVSTISPLGLRIPDHVVVHDLVLPKAVSFLILASHSEVPEHWRYLPVIAQITSVDEASTALKNGAQGLIAKGQESAGLTGSESSFVLLQRVLEHVKDTSIQVWCQGGMSLNTVSAAFAGGASGVVIDSILSVFPESSVTPEFKQRLQALDGSEVRTVCGYQVLASQAVDTNALSSLNADTVRQYLMSGLFLAVGQDMALARLALAQFESVSALLAAMRMRIHASILQAQKLKTSAEASPWAKAYGTRYAIAQGPMTRVSDTAPFAAAVAEAGALPFVALSLMDAASSRRLLTETREQVGARPWGVGVLGFADADILAPQLELIREFRPQVLLLAGGRPAQARPFVEMGIATYLHVPSPGLLDLFVSEGATHFVFEGRECGGHVGPRYSFVLWEQALTRLLADDHPERFHILFAGGIHDARSAAMVSAMSAPLAARGAKIGVLMGTAYIATAEAVSTGAVLANFQQQALAGDTTVLVETAPGHAIRCVPSGFMNLFAQEKARLQAAGVETKQIWKDLEALTVGRLRIASKGVDRVNGVLQPVSEQMQADEGMYMLGQVAAMTNEVISIAELHQRVSRDAVDFLAQIKLPALSPVVSSDPVAIVGMSCLFAGSPDLEAYWQNILAGTDMVTEVPAERWSVEQYFHGDEARKDKSISKWGAFIADTPFDPLAYGIPPASLAAIEPVQLLSLSVAQQALNDAGYASRWFDRDKTSVIFGAEAGMDLGNQYTFRNLWQQYAGEMPPALADALPSLTEDSFPGMLVNLISGRIANRLGLGGVNYAVTSACASSLTAIELAVKELRSGTSDMVLAGGADFHNGISDYLMFSSVGALSAKGRCRSFDNQADGIALGEGIGVVVLKRLSDATRDGDRIYALIDGIAGSSDGKGLGLTAPRKEGQKRALERAYAQAGILPSAVGLVEAHGTGTVVGDRTELQALTEVFSLGGAVPGQTGLGSVKSQIGHTKCAAGVAGMIKVAKALHHRVLPGTQQISQPNAWHNASASPFSFSAQPRPWLMPCSATSPTAPARGAVSAFGFGGANFHAVLSAWPAHQSPLGAQAWPAELFLVRAPDAAQALAELTVLKQFLVASDAPLALRDLAKTLWQKGTGNIQLAFVATDIAHLQQQIDKLLSGARGPGLASRDPAQAAGKVAFLFPGQGSQYVGMLRDLFVYFPTLQDLLNADPSVAAAIYPPAAYDADNQAQQQRHLTDTRHAQPALGMVEMAAFRFLQALGLSPDMAAGHSYGELVALASAGVYDADTLLVMSHERAQAMMSVVGEDAGSMAAVSLSVAALAPLLEGFPTVVMANQNSPQQTVISGPTTVVAAALDYLRERGIAGKVIDTACAFHSQLMAPASQRFADATAGLAMAAPVWPVYANISAKAHAPDASAIRASLAQHIASPVRFVAEIEQMYADGARIFVEVGPRHVLTGLVGRILSEQNHVALALDQEGKGLPGLLRSLAAMAVVLPGFNADVLFAGRGELLDWQQPKRLPATTWMINGGRAWPLKGKLPAHAAHIVQTPVVSLDAAPASLQLMAAPSALAAQSGERELALTNYLSNMRELVSAQRDVLLGYLGAPLTITQPALPVQKPARVVVSDHAVLDQAALDHVPLDHATVLLNLVSERTGYPSDMLDLDLDLEADLSIDSIKRLEIMGELSRALALRERLGADADNKLEALARQKTLRAVLVWLQNNAAVATAEQAPSVSAASWDRSFLRGHLLAIVSEATGYPEEALDLDLDLEADLSIDSIKRLEIIGQFKRALTQADAAQASNLSVDALTLCKTLTAMLDALQLAPAVASAAAVELRDVTLAAEEFPFQRFVLRSSEMPVIEFEAADLGGQRFVIVEDDRGLAQALSARLQEQGASVMVLSLAQTMAQRFDGISTLLDLTCLSAGSGVNEVKRQFAVLQTALMAGVQRVVVVTALGGDFGTRAPNPLKGGGVAGMLKSIAREFDAVTVQCLDVDAIEGNDDLLTYILAELSTRDRVVEVAWTQGRRWQRQATALQLDVSDLAQLPLQADSVVLLTGGARGITALMAVELARRFQCQVELVGRSALPLADEPATTRHLRDPRELRQALLAEDAGRKPADIEALLRARLAERDMRATLAAVQAAGGSVNYHALDVRDSTALEALVADIYARHGRIDGVIHGAGVVEDKLVRDKVEASFARVFDTKVSSALTLSQCIREDVRFVVFFSSVASAFGNRGQVDYAAANDMLDKIAHHWQARIAGRVLSVNWGPWADTGMVSPALQREYARKGIGLIPQAVGVSALFAALTEASRETQIVMMSGQVERFLADQSLAHEA